MIEIAGLTKTFGRTRAVDDLTFSVAAGRVTGFLGPNGAGKTTTLRCLLGLVTPTAGTATVDGRPYAALEHPLTTVGAALEATGFHPGRTGRDHLRVLCRSAGIPERRADETLAQVGLIEAGGRRAATYSLGMRQRLQLAAVLLGDPSVLVLDEPANGLDPEGIAWLRGFLRHEASLGRTVLVSSHVLSEVEQTVDDVVIIARGRLVRAGPLADLVADGRPIVVRTPDVNRLATALSTQRGVTVEREGPDELVIRGTSTAAVGHLALGAQVELHELRDGHTDLEQVFLTLMETEPPDGFSAEQPQAP
ncbi:MAG TPA: ATP-binding cassette domain-containing protein [Candidatus Limnocylindria bacterium]|nr:ATP-binding cassette domain-containing protein [Candidatus Limnocylindria bacterium]